VVAVAVKEKERRAERPAVPQARKHLDGVLLDLLAGGATVALLPPVQVRVDCVLVEDEPGGKSGHDGDELRPVRLAGGDKLKSHTLSVNGRPRASRQSAPRRRSSARRTRRPGGRVPRARRQSSRTPPRARPRRAPCRARRRGTRGPP